MRDFQSEARRYAADVDREAARLVREGYAPYEALRLAGEIVQSKRRSASLQEPSDAR